MKLQRTTVSGAILNQFEREEMSGKLLNVSEAAEFLGVGVGTLYHWVSEGRVPYIKLSLRCLRFRREDLEQWITENVKNATPR